MGLNFSHGEAHWSYPGFDRFRNVVAQHIGITLPDMEGFGGATPWPNASKEPLIDLLDHSDADGYLGVTQYIFIKLCFYRSGHLSSFVCFV